MCVHLCLCVLRLDKYRSVDLFAWKNAGRRKKKKIGGEGMSGALAWRTEEKMSRRLQRLKRIFCSTEYKKELKKHLAAC